MSEADFSGKQLYEHGAIIKQDLQRIAELCTTKGVVCAMNDSAGFDLLFSTINK